MVGLEPTTSRTRSARSSQLSYIPELATVLQNPEVMARALAFFLSVRTVKTVLSPTELCPGTCDSITKHYDGG